MATTLTHTTPTPDPAIERDVLDRLREALLVELSVHQNYADDLRSTVAELTGQSDSDSLLEREIAERGEIRSLAAIADIRLAVERIDDGTYGTCERCGCRIAVERLQAIPFARYCVNCPPGARTLLG